MKASHVLKGTRRERTGSRYARRNRAAGQLPGVLYGHGQDPVPVALEAIQTIRYVESGEKVFTLDLDGKKDQTVILKDVQFDYLGTNIVHVDLARVDLNEVITSAVPVRLVGEPVGMKKAGNILTHPASTLEIRCTVANLPDHIDVNIANLDVGQSIHARDITLPAGLTLADDPDAIVAAIKEIKVVEETTAEGAEVGAEAAQPEVITAKKDKEGEAGAAAPGKDDKKAAGGKGKE